MLPCVVGVIDINHIIYILICRILFVEDDRNIAYARYGMNCVVIGEVSFFFLLIYKLNSTLISVKKVFGYAVIIIGDVEDEEEEKQHSVGGSQDFFCLVLESTGYEPEAVYQEVGHGHLDDVDSVEVQVGCCCDHEGAQEQQDEVDLVAAALLVGKEGNKALCKADEDEDSADLVVEAESSGSSHEGAVILVYEHVKCGGDMGEHGPGGERELFGAEDAEFRD